MEDILADLALDAAGHALFEWRALEGVLFVRGRLDPVLKSWGERPNRRGLESTLHSSSLPILAAILDQPRPEAPFDALLRIEAGLNFTLVRLKGAWDAGGSVARGVLCVEIEASNPRTGLGGVDRATGLLDRSGFVAAMEAAGGRLSGQSEAEGAAGALGVLNVDRFRRWNETLGHQGADAALRTLADRIAAAAGPLAILGRLGADELAVYAPGMTHDRLRTLLNAILRQTMSVAGVQLHPRAAIHVAPAGAGANLKSWLAIADRMIEAEKLEARTRSFDPCTLAPVNRLNREDDLRRGLAAGEFEPFYQPVMRRADRSLAGFEALVRWRHPVRGVLTPDAFLDLAAELDVLSEIGRSVLLRAAAQLARWRAQFSHARALFMSVNLSSRELDRTDLLQDAAEAIRAGELPAGLLKLEITENQILRDPARSARTLSLLRAAGASVALDDFGAGYSSLSWLERLPADMLKIDAFFVRAMLNSSGAQAIVRRLTELAHELGMEVTAEGVEDDAMVGKLDAIGVDYLQGFRFAPALNRERADALIALSAGPSGRRAAS